MTDLLVRGVDDAVAAKLKALAAREGRSLNDLAREVLTQKVQATEAERDALWARIDARRKAIRPMPDDSTAIIRTFRDRVVGDPWPTE